jgi:hypothetical protein
MVELLLAPSNFMADCASVENQPYQLLKYFASTFILSRIILRLLFA